MSQILSSRPFHQSLCHLCQGVRYTQSKSGSLFLMCQLTERRYPPQPVHHCRAVISRSPLSIELTSSDGKRHELKCSYTKQTLPFSANERALVWKQKYINEHDDIVFTTSVDSVSLMYEQHHLSANAQLCPPGSLTLSSEGDLVWSIYPRRSIPIAWLDTKEIGKGLLDAHLLMRVAKEFTLRW